MTNSLTRALARSAFWGKSFVAELNRLSEHGERKLKIRRESMVVSPISPAGGATEEPIDPTINSDAYHPQQVDGVDGETAGIPDVMTNGVDRAAHEIP